MLGFRVDDEKAAAVRQWAERLRVDRSQLLHDAIADWGPDEDWSDWADAAR